MKKKFNKKNNYVLFTILTIVVLLLTYSTTYSQLRVDNNGRVGIKTTSPQTDLDINGKMRISEGVIQRGGSIITNTSDLGLYSRVSGSSLRFVTNNGDMVFCTGDGNGGSGSSERMRIKSNGNVGIGISEPSYKLDINGTVRFRG